MNHIRTYVLSPPEIPWRRPLAEERFRKAGLTVEWFDGIHAPTLGIARVRIEPLGDFI